MCVFPRFRWTWHHTLLLKTAGTTAVVVALELGAFVLRRANKKALAARAQVMNALIFYGFDCPMLFTASCRRLRAATTATRPPPTSTSSRRHLDPYYGETHSGYQVYSAFMILLWPSGCRSTFADVLPQPGYVLALARAQIQEKHKPSSTASSARRAARARVVRARAHVGRFEGARSQGGEGGAGL